MSEGDDLKNLPVKVAGMNELERAYQTLGVSSRTGPAASGEDSEPRSEFSMRDILYVLFRHKWKIVLIFLGLSLGTIYYIASMGQLYEAEARVFIRGVRVGEIINPTGEGGSGLLTGSRDGGGSVRSEIGIMTSQQLAEDVVDKLGPDAVLGIDRNAPPRPKSAWVRFLERTPWAAHTVQAIDGGVQQVLNALHLSKPPLTLHQIAVQAIVGGLDVAETMQTSYVMKVTYRATSPKTAQNVLNALVEAYQQKHIDINKAPVSPEFFQGRVAELRAQLTEKENQLDTERKRLNVSSLENQKAMLLNQYNTFDTELKNKAMRITALNAKITQFEQVQNKRKGTGKSGSRTAATQAVRSNPVVDQIRGRLLELKLKEADLASRYTDKNGELIDVRNQIKQMEKLISGEAASDKGLGAGMDLIAQGDSPTSELEMQAILAKVELEAENASEGMLVKQLNNTRMELDKLLGNEKTLKQLEREVSLIENEYRQYLNSRQVAEISNQLDRDKVSNVSIVQRATLPTEPVKSQRKLMALLGFGIFLSLAAGMAWAFGLEFCDHSIKTNEDVEKHLGLPVLVSLPYIKDHKPLLQEGNS